MADFLRQESEKGGEVLIIDSLDTATENDEEEASQGSRHATVMELYEVRAINTALRQLAEAGFGIEAARAALAETEKTFEPFKERMHALALHRAVARAYET